MVNFFYIFLLILSQTLLSAIYSSDQIHIRLNQVGFYKRDIKTAVVLSSINLTGKRFEIFENRSGKNVFGGIVGENLGKYASFSYSFEIDFTKLNDDGEYYIKINSAKSPSFKINTRLYEPIINDLLVFFQVQRCGYTNPKFHDLCHIADASRLIVDDKNLYKKYDVTGGWHDAGDYVKFFNTTAYTTYLMLFAFDFDPVKFGFDTNNNNVPDILEEAKIGLDWLLRTNTDNVKFVTQVQDLRDHDVGWRLPEQDELQFDRPAFLGSGKNLTGIFTATLALGANIWAKKFEYYEYADKCLHSAIQAYKSKDIVPDIDSSGTGMYLDKSFLGKLALGAVELYNVTKEKNYLKDALDFADQAGSDYWWSWGDINSLAHYKLARINRKHLQYIENNLITFSETMRSNLFGEGAEHGWGSNNTLLGIALQGILWKDITKKNDFDSLITFQRDFIFGRNPWGISFIQNTGKLYSENIHHQVSFLKNIRIPGLFAAGPVKKSLYNNYDIRFENEDRFSQFQTEFSYYRDDRMDYISNEPTISANATAIFVLGSYSK